MKRGRRRNFLAKLNRQEAVRFEVANRVAGVLSAAGCRDLPTDLSKLRDYLNVVKVAIVSQDPQGVLKRSSVGWKIEISSSLGRFERKFTEAHELGHLILQQDQINGLQTVARPRERVQKYNAVEKLCDMAAREILLPEGIVEKEAAELSLLEAINRLSVKSNCPEWFTARRLSEILPWTSILILWERKAHNYVAKDMIAGSSGMEKNLPFLEPVTARHPTFREALARRGEVLSGRLELESDMGKTQYYIDALCIGKNEILTSTVSRPKSPSL